MKNLIILTIIGVAFLSFGYDIYGCAGCGCQDKKVVKPADEVKYITKTDFLKMIEEKDIVIIDVLGAASYAQGHVKGAINIPLNKLDNKNLLEKMDNSKTYVVYCANAKCQASVKAAKLLMKHGFKNVFDYKNGIAEWKEAKLPLGKGKLCKCGMAKGSPVCCK